MDPTSLQHSVGTHPLVKFDGERQNGDVTELIDAKWLSRPGNPVTTRKATNQTIRAVEAAVQNSVGEKQYRVEYYFSDQKSAEKYLNYMRENSSYMEEKIRLGVFRVEWKI